MILYIGAPSKAAKLDLPSVFQLSVTIQFSRNEHNNIIIISNAFTKLSAGITDLIQHTNFNCLQRACIEKARSPEMLHKANEVASSSNQRSRVISKTVYYAV